jgi:hypothetical protein
MKLTILVENCFLIAHSLLPQLVSKLNRKDISRLFKIANAVSQFLVRALGRWGRGN